MRQRSSGLCAVFRAVMFLGLNLILAVCLLSLEIRIASASYPYPVDGCGESSFTGASGVVRYSEPYGSYRFREQGCSYRITVGSNRSVSLQFHTLNLQSTGGPCSRTWITLMCSLDQTKEAITKTSSEICHEAKWGTSTLRVNDCPVLFVILHKPTSDTTYSSQYRSSLNSGSFELKYEIQSTTPTSSQVNVTDRPEMECGQTLFTNRSGVIILPKRTGVAMATINCTYTIESTAQRRISVLGIQKSISLDISHFDLLTLTDSLDACDQDRLQIVCTGIGGERRPVWGCAQHFQPKYRDCVKLEIILRSDSYDPMPTRRIAYYRKPGDTASEIEEDEEEEDEGDDRSNVGCGYTIFTASSGNVTSPGFPLSHPHSIHCIYQIKVDTEKVIFLNFLRFSLESSSSAQCSYDWLKISCGLPEMNKTRKFCGDIRWTSAIRYLNCSTVSLMFYADSTITKGGFQIEYGTRARETSDSTDGVVACGGTDFRGANGTITLPNNPSEFMKTIDCTYNIFANESSFVFLNLTSINITEIANSIASCNIEQLLIACVDGADNWRFDLCAHRYWSTQPRFSGCRQVQIKLYSKYFDFQKSYEIPYEVVPSEVICGNTHFTASAGVISSPGFPRYYPPNVNCTYSIAGTVDSTISIVFPIFSLSDSPSGFTSPECRDWILMSCPSSNYVTPYADRRFCGQLTWPPVIHFFNCSTLLLKFSSGPAAVHSYAPSQFILNYTISTSVTPSNEDILPELGCGDLYISTESGRARLENNASLPLASVNCTFTTSMNGSRKGGISINMFSIPRIANESSDCSKDHIMITCMSDKATANINSSKSLRYCWNTFTGASMNYSDCDSIRFSLIYGVYIPQQSRAISYSISNKDCGDTEFSSSTGNVKSPRYPSNYPPSMHCVYTIEAGRNMTVSLKSVDVKIEGSGRTRYSYDNCAHDWLIIRCNGGTERIPETNMPMPAPFPPYDYDGDDYFEPDYHSYHHLMDRYRFRRSHVFSPPSSYLDRRLCGTDEIRTTLMNCDTVTLEFHTDSSVAYQGFNIQYNRTIIDTTTTTTSTVRPVVDYICENETFKESVGIINSPNFTDRTNCSYVIEAGESNWVILEFLALSVGSSPSHYYRRYAGDCQNTWLQVTCVPGSRIPINPLQGRRFCTIPSRNSILSGCQHVSIHFYSSVRADFRIRYTVSDTGECGKSNFTNSTGTITSPGFPLLYPDSIDCTYYVEVGADNWLSLRIRAFNLEGAGGYGHSPDFVIPSCPYDYLQLTCASRESGASSELLNRMICGTRLPFETKLIACRRAALRFVTDSSHEREGFQIEYRVYKNGEDECGNKTFSNLPGVISSPDFPSPYRDDLNCTYFLEIGGKRSVVHLQFLSFAVQFFGRRSLFGGCDSDWLQMRCVAGNVVDPNNVLNKRMCGNRLPFEDATLTGCERLALDFFSDPTVTNRGSGFQLKYRTFNPDDVCGNTLFYNSSEKLPLPKSPPNYITPFNCTYSIYVGNYSVATFDIRSFTDKTDEKTIRPKKDWILISCRGKEVNESYKITHESGSQKSLKILDCRVVIDVIFHKENETSERFFSISYELNLRDAPPNRAASHTGSKSAGVGIGIFFILIFVALIILAVVWWRRKHRSDQKLDSRPFVPDEEETEQSDPGITTTEDGFSFSVHQPDKASCKRYISLNSMT